MSDQTNHSTRVRHPIQWASLAVALAFLLVGVLGFIPGVTQDLDEIEWIGHESGAELLGIFEVSVLHNLLHLALGLIGLVLARTVRGAQYFLVGGGVVYLILWIYGLAVDQTSDANFVPLNDADNWLHLGLGVGMILLGILLAPRDRKTRTASTVDYRSS